MLLLLLFSITSIEMVNGGFQSNRSTDQLPTVVFNNGEVLWYSTKPQFVKTDSITCIPIGTVSIIVMHLNPKPEFYDPKIITPVLKTFDGNVVIRLLRRAYIYIQLSLPILLDTQRCLQIDLDSSINIGQIQFISRSEKGRISTTHHSSLSTSITPIDACSTRRIKCKNNGQCQVLANGQTRCLCPENTTGNNCENVGLRCTDIICINQASCSSDNQSCVCPLGTQSRDCSIKCGESFIQPNTSFDRIVNGESAVKNSWPYIVYIQIGERSWCSGSLIDPWHVLTAAHCTHSRDVDEFMLWFGVHRLDEREMEMNLAYPIITYENDLAILRLSQPVQETAYIRYLCLLPDDQRIGDVRVDDLVEIIGWGYINKLLSNGTFVRHTDELQQASIEILPDADCMEYRTGDLPLFRSSSMICAGSKDYQTDSCQGDSGGPLLMKYQNRWFVVGIVSFGSAECAKQGAAGIYTRLSKYSKWIGKHITP